MIGPNPITPDRDAERSSPVRIPVSQIATRGVALRAFHDPAFHPSRTRIRPLDGPVDVESDRLVSMATMIRHPDGEPLRLRGVVLAHEHGRFASWKARRSLVWEGEACMEALIAGEVEHDVVDVWTESTAFDLVVEGKPHWYTVDIEQKLANGRTRLIEIKRDERDLEDPTYRLTLAAVAEICRRCDIDFGVVLRDEIYRSRRHRRNAALVSSHSWTTVGPEHERRLDAHARLTRRETTLSQLAAALEPARPLIGNAIVHALAVRRRVRLDLAGRLGPLTPLAIV